jgi:hypothetical protein
MFFVIMTCRLFIDEVGNDDTRSVSERYLSLTGIITKTHGHDRRITPAVEALKAKFFGHDPPRKVVVLHRREIVRREPPFDCLWDDDTNAKWEDALIGLIEYLPDIAITVMIDKLEHVEKYTVWQFNPYHYCMRALIERYVLWLNRHGLIGDVVVEPRFKKQDKKLKKSFSYIYDHGTEHIPASTVQRCLTSREIKFEPKEANVCGLQLVEIIAHPSHHALKWEYTGEVMTARFGLQVYEVLRRCRYARNPKTGDIAGWGQKWLP